MPALTPIFFYDEQIRRFLLQFARIFSNFQVEYGRNEEGTAHTLIRVPVRYGDSTRQAQTILQENSASGMPSTPLMTFYISGLDYDRPRMQEPYFVSKINVRQRTYDDVTETYETTQGNAFTIERLMPVPYKLTLKLDIWTSNTNQKMQILEQMLVLFNPSLEIQGTDNYIDWTSLSIVELQSTQWTTRVLPQGTENPIDIATLTFTLPIWISSPAKVKKLGVVERIIANVFDAQGDASNAVLDNDLLLGTRQVITPYSYQTLLIGNRLQALTQPAVVQPPNASLDPPQSPPSNLMWQAVVGAYGVLRPGISYVRLEQEDGSEIVGTVAYDPTDDRFMLFDIDEDTKPANTLPPIDAVINPLLSGPGDGLDSSLLGQRYLLTEDTGSFTSLTPTAWQGVNGEPLVAKANDIIEFEGTRWVVVFDRTSSPDNIQYVTNLTTNIQYKWVNNMWVKSYEGLYPGGQWSLVL
jgi:T4-like virus Myoviridae tail sheath stabiliser